jgi:hypothetical protein
MKNQLKVIALCAPLLLASCGAKKAMVKDTNTKETASISKATEQTQSLDYVQKVYDQKVYAQNIVADMNFQATIGEKSVSVPGTVRMRRDKVIRLQLFIPLIGSEIGRLEFTPDYVLVIDRLHKQYIKGDYNQLDFLRDNGLNFYSLQALFWNQLLLPGVERVGEGDLQKFQVNLDGAGEKVPVSLKNGNISFVWNTTRSNARIGDAEVTYTSASRGNSQLKWQYADFKPLGSKVFPATQKFSFSTNVDGKARKATINIEMDELKTISDWEAESTVSSKYKQMDAKDVFGKLLNM